MHFKHYLSYKIQNSAEKTQVSSNANNILDKSFVESEWNKKNFELFLPKEFFDL